MLNACFLSDLRMLLVLAITAFIVTGVSEAAFCDDGSRSSREDSEKYCCKVARYIDRTETDQFYCEGGCCGDRNEEYCCPHINSAALPYVIGFSIFGVLVVVVVGVILFCVFRKVCKGFKDYKQHKQMLKEVYTARNLNELLGSGEQPMASPPGTIVHPVVVAGQQSRGAPLTFQASRHKEWDA